MGQGGEYFKVGGSSFGRSQSRTPTAATRPSRKPRHPDGMPLGLRRHAYPAVCVVRPGEVFLRAGNIKTRWRLYRCIITNSRS